MNYRGFVPSAALLAAALAGATGEVDYPGDVEDFIDRRELCDHFRGEEPYDAERAAFLAKQIEETCTGTDRELERLKRKYGDDDRILRMLDRFEERIESGHDNEG